MFAFDKIAEQKIQEAIQKGELDNLELKGKPLTIEDLSAIPEDMRMGYKILKNAGILPEEMQIKKEIAQMEELISSGQYTAEKADEEKMKLTGKILRFKMMMEKRRSK